MIQIHWKLRTILEQNNIPTLALSRAMKNKRLGTLYRLTSQTDAPTRVDLPTLEAVIEALRTLTGKTIDVADLLEVTESATLKTRVLKAGQPDTLKTIVYAAAAKFQPRPPSIKPRDGINISKAVRELRDERENNL
jgi:hypothetical protein